MSNSEARAPQHGVPGNSDAPSGSVGSRAAPDLDPQEAARYIGQLAGELSGIARGAKLDLLAYFLDMARMEAQLRARAFTKERRRQQPDEG